MGGVIVILTRGMGKRLTYGISARYRVVLMERLGGLFFDGGRSCVGGSLRWSLGSVPLRVSCGEYTFLCVRFGQRAHSDAMCEAQSHSNYESEAHSQIRYWCEAHSH